MKPSVYDKSESEIQQFYAGRSVFVTGVTGFIGKLLLEKLLRCCPDIENIYILIRPKQEKSAENRLESLLRKECFDPLREKFPAFRSKVVLVTGDLCQPLCGISEKDLATLQRDVSIVFHSAASVRFLETLRKSVEANVIGTRHVLNICKTLPLLEAFVHVSTAFARRNLDYTIPEEIGGCHVTPKEIFDLLRYVDDVALQKVTSQIVKEKKTTYQLSKALAELLLAEEKGDVPTAVVRPCLVNSAWKEPLPGWCDIYQGISGLTIAAGRGFLRTLYAPPNCRFLAIPVDVVVNCIIASGWYTATKRPEDTFVVNCTLDHEDFPLVQDLIGPVLKLKDKYPLTSIYRCPDFTFYESKWKNKLHATLDHYIPAIMIDLLLFIFTGKTLMLRLYRKMENLWTVFQEQGNSPWYFCRNNYNKIKNALSPNDFEIFFMETKTLAWTSYIEDSVRVGRQYMCKDDLSTLPYAARKAKIWWLVTTILKWMLIFFLIYCVIPQSYLDSVSSYFHSTPYTTSSILEQEGDGRSLVQNRDTFSEI